MKNKKIVICLSSLLAISLLATGCGKEIEVKNGSKVAVSTKGNKITATEYYESIKEDNISSLVDMIDHGILDKKYKKDSEEDKQVKEQIENIKNYYGSDENTYKQVLQQYFGVTNEKDLEENLRLEYKRTKAVQEYIEKELKDKEIQKYYDDEMFGQVKASHILIAVNVNADASDSEKEEAEKIAKEEAEKVIKQLKSGKKFADLAKKYSDDKGTATNGGDLGYFDLSDMVTEFSDAVKELKKNEYTKEPVKTEYGYHIIIKTGEKDKVSLKEAKADIKEKLRDRKLNEDGSLYYKTLDKVRTENKVKWNDTILKKAYNDYLNKLIEAANNTQG